MTAPSRRRLIICLDTALLIIFILLLSPRLTGLPLHEILGFLFFIPIVIHLLLAWPWIQNTSKKFFRTVTARSRINFLLNTVLFTLVITELVSGFVISQVVLPNAGLTTINDRAWRSAHNLPLNFTLLFAGLHIAINWDWIVSVFKKRSNIPKGSRTVNVTHTTKTLARVSIILIATAFISLALYSMIGQPSMKRLYGHNEIARFSPTFDHGMVQLLGEAVLLAIVAFVARKWLRIRL